MDHITPVLRSLHWLPVCERIDFKILQLVYKVLNGLGPKYISDLLLHYEPSRLSGGPSIQVFIVFFCFAFVIELFNTTDDFTDFF